MHSFKVSVSVEWRLLSVGYYSKGWGYGGKQSQVSHPWWSQRDEESSLSGKELWEVSSEVRRKQKTPTDTTTTNNGETHQQKHQEWWRWRDSVESGGVSLRRHSDDPGVIGRFTLWGLRERVSDNRICKHKSLEAGTDSLVPGTERRLCDLRGVSEAVAHRIFLNITGFLLK